MTYHAQMMNIPCYDEKAGEQIDAGHSAYLAYKHGHRDARHAAAEIAIQADARIAELEQNGEELRERLYASVERQLRDLERQFGEDEVSKAAWAVLKRKQIERAEKERA